MADRKNGQSRVGLTSTQLVMPMEVRRKIVHVRILCDRSKNPHFVAFIDPSDLDRFVVLEVDLQGNVVDPASGKTIFSSTKRASGKLLSPRNVPNLERFLHDGTRPLLYYVKKKGDTKYPLARTPDHNHTLGLPLRELIILKVAYFTAASQSEEMDAYPVMVCDPSINNEERLSVDIRRVLERNDPNILLLKDFPKAPRFLGHIAPDGYGYYKKYTNSILYKGNRTWVYRRLTLADPSVLLQARMEKGDTQFSIDSIVWAIGPKIGKPVLFSDRLNVSMLVEKYAGGGVIAIPSKIAAAFKIGDEALARSRVPVRPPALVLKGETPSIIQGPRKRVRRGSDLQNVFDEDLAALQSVSYTSSQRRLLETIRVTFPAFVREADTLQAILDAAPSMTLREMCDLANVTEKIAEVILQAREAVKAKYQSGVSVSNERISMKRRYRVLPSNWQYLSDVFHTAPPKIEDRDMLTVPALASQEEDQGSVMPLKVGKNQIIMSNDRVKRQINITKIVADRQSKKLQIEFKLGRGRSKGEGALLDVDVRRLQDIFGFSLARAEKTILHYLANPSKLKGRRIRRAKEIGEAS